MKVERPRRSPRLKGYDYSQNGAYFITICTQGRLCLFGDIVNKAMEHSAAGLMVAEKWNCVPDRFPGVELDESIVMPNYLHGILILADDRASISLPGVVQWFKTITTHHYMYGVSQYGWELFPGKLWQRSFYDRIIRNERMMNAVREYITYNPLRWSLDSDNPTNIRLPRPLV